MNDELSEGWATVPLGNLTRPTRPRRDPQLSPHLPYVGMEQVEPHTRRLLATIPSSELRSTAFHFQPHDVLYGRLRPYLNKVLHAEFEGLCSSEFIVLPPSDAFEPKYLALYLSTDGFVAFANQLNQGDRPRVSFDQIAEHEILLPPREEQRRIVASVETLLAKVRASQERLEKNPVILKRFRQAVLAAGFTGRLTADWRETHSASAADSASDAAESLTELPSAWCWTTVESVCDHIVDCPHSTPRWTTAGRLCVRTTNFRPGTLDLSKVRFVSEDTYRERIERMGPRAGDILYSREGGILGIACMVPPDIDLCLGQRMMLLRASRDIDSTFLMNWLNSPLILQRVAELTGGTASPHLNVGDIKEFPIPLPPPQEQREIVQRSNALFALADRLEARYEKANAQVGKLTQSVLAKAFRGGLVPTEAELARREGREYETAEELLARIKSVPPVHANRRKLSSEVRAHRT
jgi:type I restriction enzyme S subunit